MMQAFQIMLAATGIAVVTGFMISLLIQVLCHIVGAGKSQAAEDDSAKIAIAIAIALRGGKR